VANPADAVAVGFLFVFGIAGIALAVYMTFYEKVMPVIEGLAYAAVATGVAVLAAREWMAHAFGLDRDYLYFAVFAYWFFLARYVKHRRDKMRRDREKPIEFDLLSRKDA
jgi:hypothetical protein